MRDLLCNTSPLLYLHQLSRIDLLPGLYQRITIPTPGFRIAPALRESVLHLASEAAS